MNYDRRRQLSEDWNAWVATRTRLANWENFAAGWRACNARGSAEPERPEGVPEWAEPFTAWGWRSDPGVHIQVVDYAHWAIPILTAIRWGIPHPSKPEPVPKPEGQS